MRSRFVSLQQPSRAEQKRSAANRSHVLRRRTAIGEKRESLGVAHKLVLSESTRHEQNIEVARATLEGAARLHSNPGVGVNKVFRLPHQMGIGEPRKHSLRPDQI